MSQESRHGLVRSSATASPTGYSYGVDQGKIRFEARFYGCWQDSSLVVGLRVSVPRWLLAALSSLPNRPFHRAAHNMAACLMRASKLRKARERMSKTEVTAL